MEKILCFGEILWDMLPDGRKPGGAPMNVALHLNRFGINSVVASSVGDDQAGMDLIRFLAGAGLDTRLIQVNPDLPTSAALVNLDHENNATFEILEPVAWDHIELNNDLLKESGNSRAIVFGSLVARNNYTRQTLDKLLSTDMLKIMDVNLRPPFDKEDTVKALLKRSDLVKLNDDELFRITGWYNIGGSLCVRMEEFQKMFGFRTLIVTRGKNGACLIHGSAFYNHPGFTVQTVDTVGSGDAFLAGFLASMFEGRSMEYALELACAVGAFVATRAGATPDYDREDIRSLMASA